MVGHRLARVQLDDLALSAVVGLLVFGDPLLSADSVSSVFTASAILIVSTGKNDYRSTAHMARFVIVDISEPKSIPQELSHIVPFLPSVPIMPLLQASAREYGMYEHFISYPWVQPIYRYNDLDELLLSMQKHIIDPAEKKVSELAIEKAKRLERL